MLKLYATHLGNRLRVLRRHAEGRRPVSQELRDQLAEMERVLDGARLAASFLADVTHVDALPERLTMVLQNVAPYRAAYEGWIEFRRSVFDGTAGDQDPRDAPVRQGFGSRGGLPTQRGGGQRGFPAHPGACGGR